MDSLNSPGHEEMLDKEKEVSEADIDKSAVSKETIISENTEKGELIPIKKFQYDCEVCGRKFDFLSAFTRHIMIHTLEKPHACELCGARFNRKSTLKKHRQSQHEGIHTPRDQECQICKKHLRSITGFRNHYKTHFEGPKIHECEICKRKFSTSDRLEIHHQSVHVEPKRHECEICGKRLLQKSGLRKHYRIHTDEKPHNCDICGKRFMRASQLQKHSLSQHEIKDEASEMDPNQNESDDGRSSVLKPFKCDVCGREYKLRNSLMNHSRVHTIGKSHDAVVQDCDVCLKTFQSRSGYNRHLKMHLGYIKKYECDICSKKFFESYLLKRHLATHEPKNTNSRKYAGEKS